MSVSLEIAFFLAALAVTSGASIVLTAGLERLGARFRFPEALLGLLAALGADAPEISSAVASLRSAHHELALGIVLGSNIFNLAGLLGLSALIAGRIEIGREGLLFNGGVGLLATAAVSLLLLGWISPWLALAGLAVLLLPYVVLSSLQPARIRHMPVSRPLRTFLEAAIEHSHRNARKRARVASASWTAGLFVVASVVLIVLSSAAMVRVSLSLAERWSLPHAVVGGLILAILTSIPNVVAAIRLALEGRGVAVVSESLNSNTLNMLCGICLPALVLGLGPSSPQILFSLAWLLGMSVVAIAAAGARRGLTRRGGAVIVALYLVFAAAIVLW